MKKVYSLFAIILVAMLCGCTSADTPETTSESTAAPQDETTSLPGESEAVTEPLETTVAPETTADPEPVFEPTTFTLQHIDTTYTYVSELKNGEQYYNLMNDDGTVIYSVKGSTIEKFGNYVLTDTAVFTPDFNKRQYDPYYVCFNDYADGFEITSKEISDDGCYFRIEGITENGKTISFDYGISEYDTTNKRFIPLYSDGEYSMVYHLRFFPDFISAIVEKREYFLTVEGPIPSFWMRKWGEYTVFDREAVGYYTDYIMKGGEKITSFYDPDYRFDGYEMVGDYLYSMDWDGMYSNHGTIYNSKLEPIVDSIYNFTQLSDGRYIGSISDSNGVQIFDKDLNITSEIDCQLNDVLDYGSDFVLIKGDDGIHRVYSPDLELLCEFPDWKDEYEFIDTYKDTYEEFGAEAYVFTTYDYDDKGGEGNWYSRCYEFYYIPSTGVSGCYDAGHTWYADGAAEKPVLYLYPEALTDVTVTFERPEILTTVYPAYNGGWNVTAKPDGTLTDTNGRSYYCLYWEERYDLDRFEFTDGFCVKGEDSAAFLETSLAKLGFSEREANEFIIYWLPVMERNEFNLIRFELTEDRESVNALYINPTPDSLLRVLMHIKAIDAPVDIPEQELPAFERHGFVAVEWGGCVH